MLGPAPTESAHDLLSTNFTNANLIRVIRGLPAEACPQMSVGVLGLDVWAFEGLVVVPFVSSVSSSPKKEKRFPNRFHKKTPSASSRSGKDSASPLPRNPPAQRNPPVAPMASALFWLSTN